MGAKWLYNCGFVSCCFLDFFKTVCSILVLFSRLPDHDKMNRTQNAAVGCMIHKGKRTVSTVVELHSHLPPLIDILWWTRPEIKISYEGPRPGYECFNGDPSEIQKDFLAPEFYLNCFLSLFLSFIQ